MRRALVMSTAAFALVITGCSGPGSTEPTEAVEPEPTAVVASTGEEGISQPTTVTPSQNGVIGGTAVGGTGETAGPAVSEGTVTTTTVAGAEPPAPGALPDIDEELGEFEELDALLADLDALLADLDAGWAETEGDVNP